MKRILLTVLYIIFIISPEVYGSRTGSFVIRGTVTDESGKPLAGAGVTIENTFLGVITDNNGAYLFNDFKEGTWHLSFTFMGYEPQIREVKVEGDLELNVSLKPVLLFAGEVIVNATRAGMHTPVAYTTIYNKVISKQNSGQDIPFLLSMTPSLVETSEAGNGIGYTNLRIRGSDASRINVTIDGIPLNDPESQQVFWVDLPDLASSVDNIQVQRGVGTSSNGAGAFGATVSIQTKNPGNEPYGQFNTSYGSFKTFKTSIGAGTGLMAGKFAFQLRLSELKSDGFIERTGSDHKSAYLSGVFRTEKSQLKANIILGEEHTGIGWWGVPKEMLAINRRFNPAGEYTDESGAIHYYSNESDNYIQNHFQLIYSLKMNDNLSFNSAFHYTKGKGYYEEYRDNEPYSDYRLPNVSVGDTLISKTDLIRRKWMSNDFYGLLGSFKYKNKKLDLTFGGNANYYSGDHFGRIIWMEYAGKVERDHQWYLNKGEKGEVSIFSKADYSVTDKISVFGDIQYRYIKYKMYGPDDDFKDLGQIHNFGFLNPKAGIFVSLSPGQDAYISLAVAHREPTRSDFKEAAGDINATPRPETLYDSELGYRLRGKMYSIEANLYGMFYKDQLVPTGKLSNVGYSIMTNAENSHRFGIEFIAGLRPSKFFSWDISTTLSSNKIKKITEYYTEYDTTNWSEMYKSKLLTNVDIAYSPSVISGSDMNFRLPGNIELHFISKYVGKQYFDNTMNTARTIDPYFVNNLRIDFEPAIPKIKSAEFQLLINNIFNNTYESNAYGGNWFENGTEKTWSYFFPQAGINFMIRAGLTF